MDEFPWSGEFRSWQWCHDIATYSTKYHYWTSDPSIDTVYVISPAPVLSWSIHWHSFIPPPYFIGAQSKLSLTQTWQILRILGHYLSGKSKGKLTIMRMLYAIPFCRFLCQYCVELSGNSMDKTSCIHRHLSLDNILSLSVAAIWPLFEEHHRVSISLVTMYFLSYIHINYVISTG